MEHKRRLARGIGAAVAVAVAIATPTLSSAGDPPSSRGEAGARAHPLPDAPRLAAHRTSINGPRVIAGVPVAGRRLTMWGSASGRPRMLVAGCVNGERCAGEDVVRAQQIGCPPPDVDVWLMTSLRPGGGDLDADQDPRGAVAWRRAAAGLRPDLAVVFRTGPGGSATVRAAPASEEAGRRFARLAGLAFSEARSEGLAAWTTSALPRSRAITVELPPARLSRRRAAELAYALDRLVGTRFAEGGQEDRLRMIEFGMDPRLGEG
jgi:hypothetical protein